MEALSNNQIATQRLVNQQITDSKFKYLEKLLSYLGAIQAQDFAMAKWAIGARIPGLAEADVDQALEKGTILRTHILRPTWHFVAAEDLRWMLDLTAPHVKRIVNSYNQKLELTDELLAKARKIIEKSLSGNNHLTRKEIMLILSENGIRTDEWRSTHIMFDAELSGLVCSGINKGKQFTYSLIDETIKKHASFSGDGALAELTFRYFNSRGPATIPDFCWWSGLTLTKARKGVELNSNKFNQFTKENQTYYFTGNFKESKPDDTIHFLPAFDEFLIAYKDRSASMDTSHYKKVIAGYGIFKPLMIQNGFVKGAWQRTVKKDEVHIQLSFIDKVNKSEFQKFAAVAEDYGIFISKKVVIIK
ncbi:hypothetical protein FNO01nite_13530 [Flavobacterium noncentrifugens]|uniref:Winged helix DNA-binding domain-containing protein n=1 Tax=Flavobacterium noncentrifugens TaxID=1128970 RepID=A0A1G8VZ47_9FLAO|nr:winged helix DNA-binding domain-containing protein [Flavobacterium noncentrifugens]GEP50681.1 hypothetical protein FNO01nite_13530 [Flavobacterium noncentrifugens]SDJ70500.1 Winged helix DNA-binding domain-containing protein [Flavobacterium noncentrifugens]